MRTRNKEMVDRCSVHKYTCGDDPTTIASYANVANRQQNANHGFNAEVLPWKMGCTTDKDAVHFIAHHTSPAGNRLICGWLVAGFSVIAGQRIGYIYEISTRRIKDAYYGGIGQALHEAFLEEATKRNVDFVYLFPINEKIAVIYATPAWGYAQIDPELKHMFRTLRAPPSPEFLDTLRRPDSASLIARAFVIADTNPANPYLRRLLIAARPYILSTLEYSTQLETLLDSIEGTFQMVEDEGEVVDTNELRTELVDYITNIVKNAGKSLPRKIQTKKRSRRGSRRTFSRRLR
jgi:hypothetical protein